MALVRDARPSLTASVVSLVLFFPGFSSPVSRARCVLRLPFCVSSVCVCFLLYQ
jgi:hypothetical protein